VRGVDDERRSAVVGDDPGRAARRLGLTGALLLAGAALGAGALPVPNPLFGLRVLGLPGRNTTLAITLCYTGIGLMMAAWLWIWGLQRGTNTICLSRAQLVRTATMWAVPLAVAPPLFSRDVYSYLAQGATAARGANPYLVGPATALGVDDPLVRSIPTIWRDTPDPYGPVFVLIGRAIAAMTGDDIVSGIFAYRVLALGGIAAMIWALPRLARRCGVDGRRALWLGAANPLVLFHLVSGVHNDALMIGLSLLGLELGLRARAQVLDPHFLGGAALIVCASAVKLPALVVLGFLGLDWARRRGGHVGDVASAIGVLTILAAVIYLPLLLVTGGGVGWARTLYAVSLTRTWLSMSTDLGWIGARIGVLAGLGNHTDTVLALTRALGAAAAVQVCAGLLIATLRAKLDPITGVAAAMGAIVLLGPATEPWYLLWAVVPLAATNALPGYRRALLVGSTVLAPMVVPTGAEFPFHGYQLLMSIVAAVLMVGVLAWVRRADLIGRPAPDTAVESPTDPNRGQGIPATASGPMRAVS